MSEDYGKRWRRMSRAERWLLEGPPSPLAFCWHTFRGFTTLKGKLTGKRRSGFPPDRIAADYGKRLRR